MFFVVVSVFVLFPLHYIVKSERIRGWLETNVRTQVLVSGILTRGKEGLKDRLEWKCTLFTKMQTRF